MGSHEQTQARQRGNKWGFKFFEFVLRVSGLRAAYGFLWIVCLHYVLFDRAAVRSARAYICRRFPAAGRFRQYVLIYRLFVSQGRCLVDRYAQARGGLEFKLETKGFEQLDSILSQPKKGFILLTAHIGSWQVAMTALQKLNRTVHLLMRPEDNAAVLESLKIQQGNASIKILSVDRFMGGMVEVMNALEQGDIVSVMGDRSYGHRTVPVQFLGDTAYFPCSPFMIASAAQCPVVTLLSAKTGTRSYDVEICDRFTPKRKRDVSKEEQLQSWAQRYADRLEAYLDREPLQSFLFYDIWRNPDEN